MLGICDIGVYICSNKISNFKKKEQFQINDEFITEKIGFQSLSKSLNEEKTSTLCLKAFEKIKHKVDLSNIDCLILISQNPDVKIPHTSAILHKELNLSANCACFDVGLGCSGYVYGLSIILSFMQNNNLKHGLLFTCDPYRKIIDDNDKNTSLLFGDGASVTYIGENFIYTPVAFKFGTDGSKYTNILCEKDILSMNGRGVFEFSATTIPKHIMDFLKEKQIDLNNIERFIFHQGSKYIVDTIRQRLKIDKEKVPFDANFYGNTISSSIPILLKNEFQKEKCYNNILISGFGTGLSWASAILQRKNNEN
ncbi:ketoacyl-ACP synthase III [Campylobacter lari]|uniref:ketoacyl-ACP synthase III n=1 Tax=Campylobacter lari TaxID=201 RepID=UPI001277622B|nr:ketoacyl-ACP synthase III [Campylobacter lari]EAK9946140.1 ketoacyl-ACP synthase III [Campylobacter lari]EAL0271014.1 ketoacyl-ACP synthase III [Campylobacter lari]MCR6511223.1 ketoacyl-ACP synthase III [Campylobacter lari]MCR6529212.1 ketoacyl-ACP synthase III [Campylobacter lari]MCR6538313.1 ketoacyl-ACP synthase III [Campylobacter lari]